MQSAREGMAANANPALLAVLHDLHGKDVLIETIDKKKWRGIFSACSTENVREIIPEEKQTKNETFKLKFPE